MDDNSIIQFGTHKGKRLIDVPASYLLWLYEQDWFLRSTSMDKIELQNYIRENKHVLEFQNKK